MAYYVGPGDIHSWSHTLHLIIVEGILLLAALKELKDRWDRFK